MKVGENSEIVVRGPNIFPELLAPSGANGGRAARRWFHTGDQGDVDANGNSRITGRLKNLIILNSATTLRPNRSRRNYLRCTGAQHVMLVGTDTVFLPPSSRAPPTGRKLICNWSGSMLRCRTTGKFAITT